MKKLPLTLDLLPPIAEAFRICQRRSRRTVTEALEEIFAVAPPAGMKPVLVRRPVVRFNARLQEQSWKRLRNEALRRGWSVNATGNSWVARHLEREGWSSVDRAEVSW